MHRSTFIIVKKINTAQMLIKRRLDKYILMYSYNRIFSNWEKKKKGWNTALLNSKNESQKYMFKWEKSKSHKTSREYNTTILKLKKKKPKQAKIRNILFRGGYVNSKKKKSLCCFLLCSVVFKEESHRHISGSQLLLLWRQRAEGKRPIADAKILEKNTS